jgi:hypothetical protein
MVVRRFVSSKNFVVLGTVAPKTKQNKKVKKLELN